DSTFGTGGWADGNPPAIDSPGSPAIQANGKIVASQWDGLGNLGVGRYNPDGTPDTTFGSNGFVLMPGGTSAKGLTIQVDGKIVVAASGIGTVQTGGDFGVVRFLGDPVPPQIGSFTASPNPVTAGSNVTLTAANIVDFNAGGSITQVAFYQDSNND